MKSLATLLLFALLSTAALADDFTMLVLGEMNYARTQPKRYAEIVAQHAPPIAFREGMLGVNEAVQFLKKQRRLKPLALSEGLTQSALTHVLDAGPVGLYSHRGTRGSTLVQRISRFGTWAGRAAENICFTHNEPRMIVVALILDDGVKDRAHRLNIFAKEFQHIGIATGPHSRFNAITVFHFAAFYDEKSARKVAKGGLYRTLSF